MIDATTNYINPYTNKFPSVAAAAQNFNLTMEEDVSINIYNFLSM